MCYVNDVLSHSQGSNQCKRKQFLDNVGGTIGDVAKGRYDAKRNDLKDEVKALTDKKETTTANFNSKYM